MRTIGQLARRSDACRLNNALPHPAFPEQRGDIVAAEAGAGTQGHPGYTPFRATISTGAMVPLAMLATMLAILRGAVSPMRM